MLKAHGQANESRGHTTGELLFWGELRVGSGGRVDDEASDVTDVGNVAKKFHIVDKRASRIHATFDFERQHRSDAVRGVSVGSFLPRA